MVADSASIHHILHSRSQVKHFDYFFHVFLVKDIFSCFLIYLFIKKHILFIEVYII